MPAKKNSKATAKTGKQAKKTVKKKAARTVKAGASKPENKTARAPRAQINHQRKLEDTMTKGTMQFDKFAQEAANSGKENMDAMMQSGNIFMNGCEEIMKTCLSMTQEAADKNTKAMKSLMGCKTVNDLTEAQTKLIRQNFEDFIASSTKLSELSMKVATDSFAPLNTRLDDTVKKARDKVAA